MGVCLCVTHRRRGGRGMEKQAMLIFGKVCGAVPRPLPLRGWDGMVEGVHALEAERIGFRFLAV